MSARGTADHGVAAEYGYRGAGQAEWATATPASTSTDPLCAPLTGYLDSPSLEVSTSRYTHSLLGVAAETVVEDATATTTGLVREPSGRLLGAHTADQQWFYLTDALGTVVGVTGEDGTTLAAYRYDPFSQTTQATGPAAHVKRWRFAGAYLDATCPFSFGCFFNEFFGVGWQHTPVPEGTGGGSSGPSVRPIFNREAGVQYAAGKLWSFTAKRVSAELGKRWLSRLVPYIGWGFTAFSAYKSYQKCK